MSLNPHPEVAEAVVGAIANAERNDGESELFSESAETTPSSVASTTTKEKRSWFHSLTRRKKTQTQKSDATNNAVSVMVVGVREEEEEENPQFLQNNNNEPAVTPAQRIAPCVDQSNAFVGGNSRSVFQRFRKRFRLHFPSLRQRRHHHDDVAGSSGGTTDASAEFLTHSPAREPMGAPGAIHEQLRFSFAYGGASGGEPGTLESELVPFTYDYKRFIVKKWLEIDSPNRVMYRACSEMLSQVWYWGEISRRDAQKQLTDKPTGSFLVRDSETSGCQFTLSFRILNVTLHYRLVYHDNYWHFEELQYESVVEMIEDILYRCTNNNFVCFVRVPNEMQPPFPVILKYPLSRYLKMPHLQDLCRRVIQRHATPEEIAKLPLPPKLHEYLGEKRELVFQS